MKKTIEVLSVGRRHQGVSSKNGRPFDFTEFSILYENAESMRYGFVGDRMGEIVTIDQNLLADHPLAPGSIVDVEMWEQFYKMKVGVIYG